MALSKDEFEKIIGKTATDSYVDGAYWAATRIVNGDDPITLQKTLYDFRFKRRWQQAREIANKAIGRFKA